MPRPTRLVLKDGVSATTARARRYRNSSSFSISPVTTPRFIAPTAMIEAGQRSPSSNTNGTRRQAANAQPPTAAKNWGEVAAITSGRLSNNPATKALTMKLRKSRVRNTTPSLAAMNVFTRTTRMPDIVST